MWRVLNDDFAHWSPRRLAELLGRDLDRLVQLTEGTAGRYRAIRLPKRGGGHRELAVPEPELKALQHDLMVLLDRALEAPPWVLGGRRGRSFVDHAARHQGRSWLLTVDVADFFGRIGPALVAPVLREFGLPEASITLIVALAFRHGALPQGAPSSPLLANLAMAPIDLRLRRLARRRGLAFSRYFDDLAFSGDRDFGELRGPIAALLRQAGLPLAEHKTRYTGRDRPQVVTGLVVNDRLRPTRSFRGELEEELRLLQGGALPRPRLEARVEGRLHHLARFDRREADRLRRRYGRALPSSSSS
ncbi:MAG: RNA-directed DNA polymerase [Planctomycetes bacterium]|nr:RNA-directed DNA polymerase [Planctomycetota bacterium]